MVPKSIKSTKYLTPKDISQAYKGFTLVLIMNHESTRPNLCSDLTFRQIHQQSEISSHHGRPCCHPMLFQRVSWGMGAVGYQSLIPSLGLEDGVQQSDDPTQNISDFRPRTVLIFTATIWASVGAGDRLVWLKLLPSLKQPYLQATSGSLAALVSTLTCVTRD